jgi:threonylcarbamoyladenosine tRNA methylthiotransferase MtaB
LKRVAFCTFGCRLNQYDTETMRTLLEEEGEWRAVPWNEEADLYVVNTCSVTAKADARARNMIRRIHGERPHARIVATGCYAQRAPEDLAALPGVDLVLGAADRERVVDEFGQVHRLERGETRVAVSPIAEARTFQEVPITEMMDRSRAFVKIQEGCNEACSFCIIPTTRGRSRSRRPEAVLEQVRGLIASGYTEIVFTGVHVGEYGADLEEGRRLLPELIGRTLELPGLDRFRLSSIQPNTVSDELIGLMAAHDKFARHFHIPLQSGSDAVLERMRRPYAGGDWEDLIRRVAERVPDCGIGTDVICGFPGETDADFQRTFDRLAELPVTYLHPFTYSERPGSEAAGFRDAVPGDVRKRRTRALKKLSADKNLEFRGRHVGREAEILVEEMKRDGVPHLGGLTDNYLRVDLGPGRSERTLVSARLTGIGPEGMVGELAEAMVS